MATTFLSPTRAALFPPSPTPTPTPTRFLFLPLESYRDSPCPFKSRRLFKFFVSLLIHDLGLVARLLIGILTRFLSYPVLSYPSLILFVLTPSPRALAIPFRRGLHPPPMSRMPPPEGHHGPPPVPHAYEPGSAWRPPYAPHYDSHAHPHAHPHAPAPERRPPTTQATLPPPNYPAMHGRELPQLHLDGPYSRPGSLPGSAGPDPHASQHPFRPPMNGTPHEASPHSAPPEYRAPRIGYQPEPPGPGETTPTSGPLPPPSQFMSPAPVSASTPAPYGPDYYQSAAYGLRQRKAARAQQVCLTTCVLEDYTRIRILRA